MAYTRVLMCLLAVLSAAFGNSHRQYQQIDLTSISVTCNMSTVYSVSGDGVSLGCEGAIDGDTDIEWRPTRDPNPNCIFTQINIYPAYWFLNLHQELTIHKVTIYHVKDYDEYMPNVRVAADGNEVFNYPGSQFSISNPEHITRNLPVRASIIKIERTTTSSNGKNYLPLCQVQLWDCEISRYGSQCATTCSPRCQENTGRRPCDAINGMCLNGCKPSDGKFSSSLCNECQAGWYGNDCNQQCSEHCGTDQGTKPCDRFTGRCSAGCEDGWYGDKCDVRCPQNCFGACGRGNATCFGCKVGYLGPNCTESCSGNCDGVCGQYDRRCNNCKAGHWGNECNMPCNRGCQDNNCSRDYGQCTCKPGWQQPGCDVCDKDHYGADCDKKCGNCTGGARCNNQTGHCPSCVPGLNPPLCQEECPAKTYGQNCSSPCGHCADDGNCHTVTGHCPAGCGPGYQGQRCDKECLPFTHGNNCSQACGNCSNNASCNHVTGYCGEGCVAGFGGDKCTTCIAGRWGDNCDESCGHCANDGSCHIGSGECLRGCSEGWNGTLCMQQVPVSEKENHTDGILAGPIVGGLLGAGAVLGLSVLLAALIIRRHRSPQPPSRDNVGELPMSDSRLRQGNNKKKEMTGGIPDSTSAAENNYDRLDAYVNPDDMKVYTALQTTAGRGPLISSRSKKLAAARNDDVAAYQNVSMHQ